ncbi:MAG: protein kinase, partial [Actinomycetia bacterium]|nr:protein kinase [Actinomycetes bacterium]
MEEKLLLDRYRILAKVGEGATAKVYRAFDTKIGRDVAIKEIKAGPSTAPRVIREIRTVATLNHPNIVTVFEFEETKEYYY